MPKDKGLRDEDMRFQQLQHRKFELEEEIKLLQKQLADIQFAEFMYPRCIDEEVEFSKIVDEWLDCPRLDSDEHPTIIFETGNSKKIPYFFTEYKQVFEHKPYPSRMSGYNWQVAMAVADKCERPLLHVEYCWDVDDDKKYATYYVEAVNKFAKDRFDKISYKDGQSLPHRVVLSELSMVKLSFLLRDKSLDLLIKNKDKFSNKKNVNVDFWKGI